MHPFAAATAPSLVLLLLLLFSLSTTQYSLADANYNEISPISTDSDINQVIFDPDHRNSSLPLLVHKNKNEDEETYVFNITARKFVYFMKLQLVLKDDKDDEKDVVVEAYGTPDTGSELTWLNLTCGTSTTAAAAAATHACIEIKEPETFKCETKECKDMRSYLRMEDDKCIKSTDKCVYKIRYKDDSYSEGYFGKGRFRFGDSDGDDKKFEMQYGVSTGTVPKEKKSKGVVGLGRGKLSLFQQLKDVDFKFSYCLPQYEKIDHSNEKAQYATGKLVFGSQVNINQAKSTPLLDENSAEDCNTRYYCVKLRSIKVDGRDKEEGKEITVKEWDTTEVMVIDSGSTFTSLRGHLFDEFLGHVKQEIGDGVKELVNPDYKHCFEKGSAEKLEKVSLGFEGTTVELKRENIFDPVKDKNGKGYLCLTVENFDEGKKKFDEKLPNVHILGSRAQMDFEVKFDVPNKKVSFDKVKTCNLDKMEKNSNDVE